MFFVNFADSPHRSFSLSNLFLKEKNILFLHISTFDRLF